MNRKVITLILISMILALGTSCLSAADPQPQNNDILVENLSIESEGYSMYTVSADIVPKKDFNYLEMEVVFYDSDNAVIGKSPFAWNMNEPVKDQLIKASGTAMTDSDSTTPARAEIFIYDSSIEDDPSQAIFSQNVTMN